MALSDTGVAVIPKYTGGVGDYTKLGVRYNRRDTHAGGALLPLEPQRYMVIAIRHNIALPLAVWTWDV